MKKIIALVITAIISLTSLACGGSDSASSAPASVASLNSAVKTPNAVVDTATTEKAIQTSIDGASSTSAAPGVPSFGFLAPAQIRGAFPLPGDFNNFVANADGAGSGFKDAFAQLCTQQPTQAVDIEASKIASSVSENAAGCTGTGTMHYEYACTNNNNSITWSFKYNNFSIACTNASGSGFEGFSANGTGEVLIGLNKDSTRWGIRAFYDMSGAYKENGTSQTYTYAGGGGVVYDATTYKLLVAAVVVGIDGKYVVFLSGNKDNPQISREDLVGKAIIVKGGNGNFVALCEKNEKVQCALWKQSDMTLVSSTITPTPDFPAGADTVNFDDVLSSFFE